MADKMIRARVVAPSYGFADPKFRGDVVEVTETELKRVGPKVLAPIGSDEEKVAVALPSSERKKIEAERKRVEARRALEEQGEVMLRQHQAELAAKVVASGGDARATGTPGPTKKAS